jgi:pseudouridine-5'-phosphate glycosidase
VTELLRIAPEVSQALHDGGPVVALETTLVAHGFPPGVGVEVALEAEASVRSEGAVPATVGVLDGAIVVGLDEAELSRFGDAGPEARKAGPRDLAACVAQGALGATTVGGTLAACRATGIRFMGTGGIGGVHRGFAERLDVSADLAELARTQALVVSSGVKSLLDVPGTAEVLETVGVPALGFRTDTLPRFYSAGGGPSVSARVEEAGEAARIARAHWELGGAALLLGRVADEVLDDAEALIEEALNAAAQGGVTGQEVTPFVLSFMHEHSGGRTLTVNRDLIVANAGLAAKVAVAFAAS